MKKRVNNYAFIDSQNVNLAIRDLGWKLDWRRFRVHLRETYGVEKAFLFEQGKLEALLVPNRFKFSALLKFKIFRPYVRYMNELKAKLSYEKKRPHEDGTS